MTTKRIVTGAHYGLRDWLAQRITAIALALYTLYLLFAVLTVPAARLRQLVPAVPQSRS